MVKDKLSVPRETFVQLDIELGLSDLIADPAVGESGILEHRRGFGRFHLKLDGVLDRIRLFGPEIDMSGKLSFHFLSGLSKITLANHIRFEEVADRMIKDLRGDMSAVGRCRHVFMWNDASDIIASQIAKRPDRLNNGNVEAL